MHNWVTAVQQTLQPLANSDNAGFMKAYMRDQFAFLGIQSGPRRAALKHLLSKEQCPTVDALSGIVSELWSLPEREYQLVAVDLLIKFKSRLPISFAEDVQTCITHKSWWDTVDFLATHIAAQLFLRFPNEFAEYLHLWSQSDNLWLRRTTLLYQLKYKNNTNAEELFRLIKMNQQDNQFFIQKAIGWSLREYSKTAPQAVIDFLEAQNIQGLARREGLKWLKKKGD